MLPDLAELTAALRDLIKGIADDDRTDSEAEEPSQSITVGWDPAKGTWGIQVGDNSFTGTAYSYPVWQVAYLSRESDAEDIAREIIEGLSEQGPTEENDPDGDSLA